MIARIRSLEKLEWLLSTFPVVAILGARQVGKTTLARDFGDEQPRPVPKSTARPRERDVDDIVAQSKAAVARTRPVATPRTAPVAIAEKPSTALDAVLDKIASEGMASLTTAEKLLLDEWSKRLRDLNGGRS